MFCKKCGKELNKGTKVCPNCGTKLQVSSLVDLFDRYIWVREDELTDSDCFAYPQIPEYVKGSVRENFEISYNEEILFVRDTSFWNTRDQGLVISDGGVYFIQDNDRPNEKNFLSWGIIKNVDYKDSSIYFWGYGDDTDYFQIHISFFMKHDDYTKTKRIGNKLAEMFTLMAQNVEEEDPFNEACEYYDNLLKENNIDKALQFALSTKDTEGFELFYLYAGSCYVSKGDYNKADIIFNEGLKKCEDKSPLATWLYYYKYSSLHESGNDIEARKFALPVIQNATDDMKLDSGISIKEDAINDLSIYDNEYVMHFLEQPYNKRKILSPVNYYTDLRQNHLNVIDIKKLSNSGIIFPIGHPIALQLYVGHPYIKKKYLPFDNYELELIEDKVREFCQLVQCLGAKEISIECINSMANNYNSSVQQNVSGKVDYMFASASGSGNINKSQHLIDEISKSINLHQKFKPRTQPYLPDGLVWYPNEPSWQRLYEQRMHGELLQHEERIETRKSRVFEGSELSSIEGEFKNLILSCKGNWNKNIEEKFEMQENAVLSIHVKFISLNELKLKTFSTSHFVTKYSDKFKGYFDEVRACLAEGKGISNNERRLLEKLRKHLNVPEELAMEIENSLSPMLTDEEKEYLEEYKLCLEDGHSVTAGERRLLDKLRKQLGISENRAKEIENTLKNQ